MRRALRWLGDPIHMAVVAFTAAPFLLLLIFMNAYEANFPRGDDFARGMPIAIATLEGDLTASKLLSANIGQVAVFTKLVTVVVTLLTDWNVIVESYVTVALAVAGFGVLVMLIARRHPQVTPVAVIITSVLYFSVHQNTNWYISHNSWFFPQLFFLLAAAALYQLPRSTAVYATALMLSIAATYSHGNGMVAFPALLVALWARGYRRWYLYAIWLVIGAASIYGYTELAGVSASVTSVSEQATNEVSVVAPVESARFALVILGSMFVSHNSEAAIQVGILALGLLAFNTAYLWRVRGEFEAASLWGVLSLYTLGTAALIGLTRFNTYPDGLDAALGSRYLTATVFMWAAITVTGAVVVRDAAERGGLSRIAAAGNIAAAAGLFALFGPSVYVTLGRPYYDEQKNITEACYMRALYIQDSVPLFAEGCPLLMGVHLVNELSVYELTMFAQDKRVNILGESYTPGTPVVVEGDNGWVNYHVAKWLLDGVPSSDTIHVMPSQPVSDYPYRDVTLPNPITDADAETLLRAVGATDGLWVVQRTGVDTAVPAAWAALSDDGYLPTRFTYTTPEDITFTVTRYQRLAATTDAPIMFGDAIRMTGFTGLDGRLEACGRATVRSFWEMTADSLPDGYSATMTLDRITGPGVWDFETVARQDSQLTLTETDTWEPDELYLDDRSLDVPCELPPGEYVLRMGVYNYRDGERLPPTADGQTFPAELNMATLETIRIGEGG